MIEDTKQPESFRVVDRQTIYRGRAIDVYLDRIEFPDGRVVKREIVTHPGAVAIVPSLPSGHVLLVRQTRLAAGSALWEIPAGTLEPGENPLDCAKRELVEETGYTAASWREVLTFFTTPGFSNERITLFCAMDLRQVGRPDPDEIAECRSFSPAELSEMFERGALTDGKTILALLWSGLLASDQAERRLVSDDD
ncbi:MAG: NUDIX hydrolase [Candidatus Bipolaricaulia bacterium]